MDYLIGALNVITVYEFRVGLLDALSKHLDVAYISNNTEIFEYHNKMSKDIMKFLDECSYDDMLKKPIKDLKYNKILHGKYLAELREYLPEKFL